MHKSGKLSSVYISTNEVRVTIGFEVPPGGKRGKIAGITRRSRSALTKFINAIEFETATFVTLTYRYNMQNDARAYHDLRKLHKRLVAAHGAFCAVWRKELQERGAIHYHLFLFDAPAGITQEAITDEWLQVTDQDGDTAARLYGVRAVTFDCLQTKDAGVIISYLVKYAAKDEQTATGKAWGILGRKHAKETVITSYIEPAEADAAVAWISERGCQKYAIEGGGVQYRFCFGHLGERSGHQGIDSFSRTVAEIGIDRLALLA
jgi:hypothetical protein